jgi:pimeloyl-ACP methyl ester carboxylesterase
MMLVEKRVDVGPVVINYAEGDASGMPLVLLHEVCLCWHSFLPVLPLFAQRYHTYALDLRGHGHSGHTPGCIYEIEEYGDDIFRFLRARVGEPAVLLGHSLGAEVALWVAAAAPERVQSVVLEEPGLYTLSEYRFMQHPIHQRLHVVYEILTSSASEEEMVGALQTLLPDADEEGCCVWTASLRQMDPMALAHFLDGSTSARICHDELLAQVKAPVLLLQGNPLLDGLLTDQDIQQAQTLLDNCTHLYRADLGHDWHGTAPLLFFQLVTTFIGSRLQ